MESLNKMQINLLRGSFTKIAKREGCSPAYVSAVLRGKYENRDTRLIRDIKRAASELLDVLQPKDQYSKN